MACLGCSHTNMPFSSILTLPKPVSNKTMKIFIQKISPVYNQYLTSNNCTSCDCLFDDQNGLEPLIHCIIEQSDYVTESIKEATFIFVPVYSSLLVSYDEPLTLPKEVSKSDEFRIWKGSRHLLADARFSFFDDDQYMSFKDQHVVIAVNLTVDFIRQDRWLHSRHIQVPPLQVQEKYHNKADKKYHISILAKEKDINELNNFNQTLKQLNTHFISLNQTYSEVIKELEDSNFTIFIPNENLDATFLYEIIRSYSIPIMISDPFLPAFAHTHIDYDKISMRIPKNQVFSLMKRINSFTIDEAKKNIEKIHQYLMWPLNLKKRINDTENQNAGTILLDYINTRHRVLKPVLRRTYLGSDEYI